MNARARLVRPDFFLDEDAAQVSVVGRLLLVGLWTMADREGRLEDRPARIKALVFPYDLTVNVDHELRQLDQVGLIYRYEVNGKRFVYISNFLELQRPHVKEPPSTIPPPPVRPVQAAESPCKVVMAELPAPAGSPDTDTDTDTDADTGSQASRGRAIPVAPPTPVARPTAEPRHSARPPENLYSRLLEDFSRQWTKLYGVAYLPTPADRAQLGRLLQSLPPDAAADLPRRFANYLTDASKFVAEEMRHSLRHFCTAGGANKYSVQAKVATTVAEKNALFIAKLEQRERERGAQ